LLAADKRIGNSIRLDVWQVLLLTGANASGKSTFLRSIAFAILMSRMGLPVRASHCELQAQRLATVMRIQDALWQGMSRFQAEVKQLKAVLDRSQSLGNPVVLILDEILAGTNSEERRRGSLAFIRHLSDYQGLILITTHDLALAEIAITEPQRICCYHFADRAEIAAESADVLFDYKLRPGVLQSTNALQVMQAAGLPIE
jgi:DNA mismatch repair ATPase MutS